MPDSPLRRLRNGVLVSLLFAALAAGVAYPDVRSLKVDTPGDYADGHFYQWNLYWDIHSAPRGLDNVFNGNIYWPNRNTVAYSDPLLAAAPVVWVLTKLFGYPGGYGLTYLLTWVASLWGMYLLAMWFTRKRAASILAAIVFTFATPRLVQFLHFQLAFAGALIPFTFYFLVRFLDERRIWLAAATGICFASIAVTAGYYGAFMAIAVACIVVWWVVAARGRLDKRFVIGLALTGVISLGLSAPIVMKYVELQRDPYFQRSEEFAARPFDFLAPMGHSYLYGFLAEAADRRELGIENRLFPGFLAVALALTGSWSLVRARRAESGLSKTHRRALAGLFFAGAVALVLAFGGGTGVAGHYIPFPYALLAGHVPGFRGIRAPSRFVVISMIALALLAAFGFSKLTAGFPRWAVVAAAALAASAMVAEYAAPLNRVPAIKSPRFVSVNKALARLPAGPVVELPMGDPESNWWGYIEAPRMVLSRIDWHPRVNGYSGFAPPNYLDVVNALNSLAGEDEPPEAISEGLSMLDSLKVRYIIARLTPMAEFAPTDPRAPLAAYNAAAVDRLESVLGQRITSARQIGDAVLIDLKG